MIYISIDNDYHTSLATSLVEQCNIKIEVVKFISHISPRNNFISSTTFNKIEMPGHPLSSGSGYKNIISYFRSIFHQIKLRAKSNFTCEDILIVITEYQLNNAIFAKKMKSAGGRVFLFDEGIGFYFNNSPYHRLQSKLIDKFYLSLYNLAFHVMGIPAYAKKGQEGRMYACIKDTLIDRIYSRLYLPIERQIPVYGYRSKLNSAANFKEQNREIAIIFTSNFECFNLRSEEMHLAALAIEQMAGAFTEVYIKIHPSDYIAQNEIFHFYASMKYQNVKLVDNSFSAIQAINTYCPGVVVGSMSTSLFDALLLGCQPIFLFHLLPALAGFGVYKFTLDSLNYNFISSLSDISPRYQCNVDVTNLMQKSDHLEHIFNEIGNQ